MNKKLLLVFLLLTASVIGQNVKSITRYNWNSNTWTENWKDNFSQYNSNNQAAYHLREIWNTNNNNWKNQNQSISTFNSNNLADFVKADYWNTSTNSWVDMSRGYLTYDANGNLLTQTIQTTNNGAGWIDWQFYNLTYDDNGHLILKVIETWVENQLNTAVQYIYINNPDGTVNTITEQRKNIATQQWENYYRETHSYTDSNKTAAILSESYQTFWFTTRNRKFVYDSNQYLIAENDEFWNSDHFELSSQRIHTNDDNGKILETIQSYIYQPDSNYKLVYEYETLSAQSLEGQDVFILSPNPAQDFLDLNFSNSIQGQIKISDATGKTLMQQSIDNQNSRINMSILPSGLYFMEFRNNDVVVVKKFIKN